MEWEGRTATKSACYEMLHRAMHIIIHLRIMLGFMFKPTLETTKL